MMLQIKATITSAVVVEISSIRMSLLKLTPVAVVSIAVVVTVGAIVDVIVVVLVTIVVAVVVSGVTTVLVESAVPWAVMMVVWG